MSIVPQHTMDTILAVVEYDKSWEGSPNELVKILPTGTKGKVGSEIAKRELVRLGLVEEDDIGPGASAYDALIDGRKVEFKMSTVWKRGKGNKPKKFKFQQLRDFHTFDRCIFVAICPGETKIWWATRADLDENVFSSDNLRQHGGKDEKSGTYWFWVIGEEPPEWFQEIEEWNTPVAVHSVSHLTDATVPGVNDSLPPEL